MGLLRRCIRLYPVVGLRRDDVDRLGAFVKTALAEACLDGGLAFAAGAVAEELCTNVLEHSDAEWLELEIEALDGDLAVTVRDNGSPFDPADILAAFDQDFVLEDQTDRRLGLYIVRQLAKQVSYRRDESGRNLMQIGRAHV